MDEERKDFPLIASLLLMNKNITTEGNIIL